MESASLTIAHAFARDACHDPSTSAFAAADKHRAAAGEFAKAADGVDDAEALRVLGLLEQHHHRLARIVSSGSDRTGHSSAKDDMPETYSDQTQASTAVSTGSANIVSAESEPGQGQPPTLQRKSPREMSSAIATNLATARGIPNHQQRKPQQLSPTSMRHDKRDTSMSGPSIPMPAESSKGKERLRDSQSQLRPTFASASSVDQQAGSGIDGDEGKTGPEHHDNDPFQKFYATFEGLLTKLSAPLAFAGLPLVPEERAESKANTAPTHQKTTTNSDLTPNSPEISKIFSKAALRAVKEEHGGPGVQESFLVVPTAGGTVTYAGILSRAEGQTRHYSLETPLEHAEEGVENFVDAQEVPEVGSSKIARQISGASRNPPTKNAEELQIENDSLKQLTDNLSRRLYMWEKSAQSQSMALQQSIRNLQPPSRPPSDVNCDGKGVDHDERLRELEEQFMAAQRELQRYGRENEKLRTVVMRYRERWEKLKEGARVRREGAERGVETPSVES